jgi:glyoxylate reductase
MTSHKPLVIVTRKLPSVIEERMKQLFNVHLNADDKPLSKQGMVDAVNEATVLVSTVTDKIGEDILSQAGPKLKMIANYGVGVDHIDLKTARNKMITVTNTPGVLTDDTADMAMALLLGLSRRMGEGERMLRANAWKGWAPTGMLGTRLSEKKLGIIGMGRIGQAVARRAKAFGMSIHYHNRSEIDANISKELGATYWQSLDHMITQMDVISLNCPHTDDTHHLMSEHRLGLMQKHALLINTARGDVIDELALIETLEKQGIRGAGLDVFENEPNVNPSFFNMDNVVIAPHMGSATEEAREAMGQKVIINVKTFLDGHSAPDRVISF